MLKRYSLLVFALFLAGCMAISNSSQEETSSGSPGGGRAQDSPEEQPAATEPDPISGPTPVPARAPLEDYGPAPELTNEVWLNADGPLRLEALRGQVVLLEMWTFG